MYIIYDRVCLHTNFVYYKQQFGCWAIRNLAENAENRVYIGQVGGLQAVTEPMKVTLPKYINFR